MRVLLLEEEGKPAQRVIAALNNAGHHGVTCVGCDDDLVRSATQSAFDVVIIDCMKGGVEALRRLRALDVQTPALLLSDPGDTRHRVEGLNAGADDCLARPFDDDELVARLSALTRRTRSDQRSHTLAFGPLEVCLVPRSVLWRGQTIGLSPKEFALLRLLAENAGRIVSREIVWSACWPEYRIPPQINVIDVNLSRLRTKLEAVAGTPVIRTIRCQGFMLPTDP